MGLLHRVGGNYVSPEVTLIFKFLVTKGAPKADRILDMFPLKVLPSVTRPQKGFVTAWPRARVSGSRRRGVHVFHVDA